jgi:hypothetical protein
MQIAMPTLSHQQLILARNMKNQTDFKNIRVQQHYDFIIHADHFNCYILQSSVFIM